MACQPSSRATNTTLCPYVTTLSTASGHLNPPGEKTTKPPRSLLKLSPCHQALNSTATSTLIDQHVEPTTRTLTLTLSSI
eukprot:8735040-Ditylum_brightwellii.AAC.1